MLTDMDPLAMYHRFLARWPLVFAAGMMGAVLGLAISYLRTPEYQASAILGIAIDRQRADVPDDITVLQAYERVRALLLADDTLEEALALEGTRTIGNAASFRERIRLAEGPEGWALIVMAPTDDEAERLAQAWADAALAKVEEASLRAIRAAEWQRILFEASCSLMASEQGGGPRWLCRSAPPSGASEGIPASVLREVEASRGILPVLSYSLVKPSRGTARLVLGHRGTYVLLGALMGLTGGTLGVVVRKRRIQD